MPSFIDPCRLLFIDTETQSFDCGVRGDVTRCGVYAYRHTARVVLITYAIGIDGEPGAVLLPEQTPFDPSLVPTSAGRVFAPRCDTDTAWRDVRFGLGALPVDFYNAYSAVYRGEMHAVAWNSQFDRVMMNQERGLLKLRVEQWLDAMFQAMAANLPGKLDMAGQALRLGGKDDRGKGLIQQLAGPDAPAPSEAPDLWAPYVEYGLRDVALLRDIFLGTRPLPVSEWEDLWVSERINDRGVMVDTHFAARAAALATAFQEQANDQVEQLTNGRLTSVKQHAAMADYVYQRLENHAEAREILVRRYDEDSEDGLVPAALSLDRYRVEQLIAYFDDLLRSSPLSADAQQLYDLLVLRQFGASATPGKFQKELDYLDPADARLKGQYVANGAQQTGRFSSRGVQIHNLTREALKSEAGLIEAINETEL